MGMERVTAAASGRVPRGFSEMAEWDLTPYDCVALRGEPQESEHLQAIAVVVRATEQLGIVNLGKGATEHWS
jgi:hypothetical protein